MNRDKYYFEEMKLINFSDFMACYDRCKSEFDEMVGKYGIKVASGKPHSKNHFKKMRKKTLELEKFGLIFRSKTLKLWDKK